MATCPNKNLESWKNLVAARGEDVAYYLWDKFDGNVPDSESRQSIVKSGIKATNALQSPKAAQVFSALERNKVTGDAFWNKIQQDLQIPKEQLDLLKSFGTTNREELITGMLANYSFAVEINVGRATTERQMRYFEDENQVLEEEVNIPYNRAILQPDGRYKVILVDSTGEEFSPGTFTREEAIEDFGESIFDREKSLPPSQYYSNLTVPGGTNYTENEIATPAITPSIKGHAQFATDQGIGWFRSDDKAIITDTTALEDEDRYYSEAEGGWVYTNQIKEATKTRRILEVQSDLFQKGRDKDNLTATLQNKGDNFVLNGVVYDTNIKDFKTGEKTYTKRNENFGWDNITEEEYNTAKSKLNQDNKENKFLQLLNKDNNWVTFFVKSIIQDSMKKGYEKVLFPSGNTASKVEGHTTLEEFKKQKEDRIKELEKQKQERYDNVPRITDELIRTTEKLIEKGIGSKELNETKLKQYKEQKKNGVDVSDLDNEINQLKQELERVDKEGFAALKPIYKFYEEDVANVLKKQGYTPKQVTDEYGNTWTEISITPEREMEPIYLQKEGTETSKASPKTLAAIKDFLKRIGVDIKALESIVVNGVKQDANGAALIMQKLVQVVRGTEASSLPEEAMHFAVEIIEQTNPQLFNKLLKEINSYRILNQVIADYGTNPLFQTKDGKPDIRKLKKEAIAKVLTETVIKKSEGTTEKPENLAKVETWWDSIINFFKNLFIKSGFDEAAMKVVSGEFEGTAQDLRNDEVYLQQSQPVQQQIVNKIKAIASTIESLGADGYKVNGKKVRLRVTDLAKTWLDNRFADNNLTKSDFQKAVDELKREKGDAGHLDTKHMLQNYFLDADGKFIADPANRPDDSTYKSRIDPTSRRLYDILKKSMEERLQQFYDKDPNTIFLSETPIYDPQRDLAGTVDFIAIDSEGKVDILDWKFMDQKVDRFEDIPWYKVQSWNKQMGNYKAILRDAYNVNFTGVEQTQMIPIRAVYSGGDAKLGIKPQLVDVQVGNINLKEEVRAYLLPVGLPEQKEIER